MILKIIFFVLILIASYIIIENLYNKEILKRVNNYISKKNEDHYEKLLKYYEKNKKIKLKNKINYFRKIDILIDRCGLERNCLINSVTILMLGIISVVISYILAFSFFKIFLLSVIISIPVFFLPFAILNFMAEYREEKIEKVFLNFLLQLKNHTKINNDIIYAFSEVKTMDPLQGYIRKFLVEISNGIRFEKVMKNLKDKISNEQIKMFFGNLEYCHLYGGNFSELIEKSYKVINDMMREKSRRIEETRSARIVLFILIFLDFVVYMSFIKSDPDIYLIMRKNIIGNMILYWNFISMWFLVFIASKVKKLDY